jgi:hypothetical protein
MTSVQFAGMRLHWPFADDMVDRHFEPEASGQIEPKAQFRPPRFKLAPPAPFKRANGAHHTTTGEPG